MQPWPFYPAFIGTLLSVTGLSYLALKGHSSALPRTLSELATGSPTTLKYFRTVLWVCGTLFAMTMYFFVIPRVSHRELQTTVWSLTYVSELLLAAFPAIDNKRLHNLFSYAMGCGMLASAYLFALGLTGTPAHLELMIAIVMTVLATLFTFLDRKKFIFYELPFIYLSHISILVAALALR